MIFKNVSKTKLNLPRTSEEKEFVKVQEFLDMCSPNAIRFWPDYYICGSSYRSIWAIREYPPETSEQAILRHLGEKSGVTLHLYTKHVAPAEERKIISNATNKNRMNRNNTNDIQQNVIAESNLRDVTQLIAQMHRNREPLLHCAVYIELSAMTLEALKELQSDVTAELTRSKISVDRLLLQQNKGFDCVHPCGSNVFKEQFERVLPASSVANLYPINYSGKTDPKGFYLGQDKYGSNIITDFNRRAEDKTNANILILGNSGRGKSYLMKLIHTNLLESGMNTIGLDPENEYQDMVESYGGTYYNLLDGRHKINLLEPKRWGSQGSEEQDEETALKDSTLLSQHISFLRDVFRKYKEFTDEQIDVLEILLQKLYQKHGIDDRSDFNHLWPKDYPIMEELYAMINQELEQYDENRDNLYSKEYLHRLRLGLHSMCIGPDSKYFNGHTNLKNDRIVFFGVKELLEAGKEVKDTMLFNTLAYMSNALLTEGNTAMFVDELYLFLTNPVAITYLRNFEKRVRKKESAVILASQNIEDFLQKDIAELTKPLFSIPTHQFLFHPGSIDKRQYMDLLQLEDSEYDLIETSAKGQCLYKCGNERYNLVVKAPSYKATLFGNAGGR